MILRGTLRAIGAALGLLSLAACQSIAQGVALADAELIITGGTVFDGTLSDGRAVDIVVADGKIAFVGKGGAARYSAKRTIDATGLIVAPGFIDSHTHAEDDLATEDPERQKNLPYAFQGVTTVVVGNDGFGFSDFRKASARHPAGTNYAFHSGLGDIRRTVMGMEDRPATADELDQMRALVRRDMCAGAVGFSASLRYAPQRFTSTAEVVELASEAARHGGYYDTHMRDESEGVFDALDEAIAITRQAGMPLHVSHIKALGPAVWGESARMIAMIEGAQAKGHRVTADQYPWAASGTRISRALVPGWALDGGLKGLRERLKDRELASRIRAGIIENIERRGGPESLLITAPLHGANVEIGQTLGQRAAANSREPEDEAIAVLKEGDARLASFNMSAADIAAFAEQEWVVTGSDGTTGHPRKYGSFPKAYRDYVINGEMSLARFIQRSSAKTAEIIGLKDRGFLKPGYAADIVVFDPATFAPRATYQEPEELSVGVKYLIVNGEALISEGEYTGTLPGTPLLKETSC